MERRLGEEIATDCPVADVTQPSQVTIGGRDRAIRVSRLEVLDRVRAFERRCRQGAELSAEDVQLTQHPSPALERLDLDVASAIQLLGLIRSRGRISSVESVFVLHRS
jgi:hypothetical protein